MADELGKGTLVTETRRRKQVLVHIAREYEDKIKISVQNLEKQVADVIRNAWDISHDLRVGLKRIGVADTVIREAVGEEALKTAAQGEPVSSARSADLSPGESSPSLNLSDPLDESDPGVDAAAAAAKRQNLIFTAVNEIAQALTGDFKINNVLTMIVEAMYRGVISDHVLMAMANPKRTQVTARFGLGDDFDRIREAFDLPLREGSGLPARCILEKQEFVVDDVRQKSQSNLMPRALMKLLGPQSLIFMPLVVKDNAIGLFLVSRKLGKSPFDKQDLRDVRTLRNQALLAIHQPVGHR